MNFFVFRHQNGNANGDSQHIPLEKRESRLEKEGHFLAQKLLINLRSPIKTNEMYLIY